MAKTALIDGDILLHEIGWGGQFVDPNSGEEVILKYERVGEILDKKIELILDETEAEEPLIFLSSSERINKMASRAGYECTYVPNFRYDIAVTKPYKGTRNNPKPYHFYNIVAHLLSQYPIVMSEDGYEADDMMGMYQCSHEDTIICSRDKDLRITPGWHYSWECGKQASVGPVETDKIGWLELVEKKSVSGTTGKITKTKELKGYGLKFFFSQMLTGDTADNIPGLKGVGVAAAYKVLDDLHTEKDLYMCVKNLYKEIMGEGAREFFLEQSKLLWIAQQKGKFYEPR